ncbi:YoaK family protein [Convivina intestini]|uniref:Uncharacterized membrane protein YoaK (UPF0700 family) n=1 Tax=Convivina intestini TaxID=1505726 RepID=A0A2U1D597_9LACO|nr:YoaK family protein [Convivina intestini]PVY82847.1 uncharacterized membrane protein YoaK (UPF0700 family) [Convivina intestini]CAH1856885.1 hypothetical protein R077811_01363 [Convivina intestini]SDC11297.1 Uncharacterized membrane protein YoaK, UPF0700 family [Leuconostocaceae bacterium R-53105]
MIIKNNDSLFMGALLTMLAGSIDAYSFLIHGGVFAGLQTGNLILLGIEISHGNLVAMQQYIFSIVSFALGAILVRYIQHKFNDSHTNANFRKIGILVYQTALLVASFYVYQQHLGILSTALISMAAASELQEFKMLKGKPFTPIMMTGNLRKISESGIDWLIFKQKAARHAFLDTLVIIGGFVGGATLTGLFIKLMSVYALVVPIALIFIIMILIIIISQNQSASER